MQILEELKALARMIYTNVTLAFETKCRCYYKVNTRACLFLGRVGSNDLMIGILAP